MLFYDHKMLCIFNFHSFQCAKELKINYGPIKNCTVSDMGNQLEHQMALKTNSLSPPHQYVPWVTLNGVSSS